MKTRKHIEYPPKFQKLNRKQSTDDENPTPEKK